MPTQYLIDSSIWIEYLNGNMEVRKWVNNNISEAVFSPITYAEVSAGMKEITKKYKLFQSIYNNSRLIVVDAEIGELTETIHKQVRAKGFGHHKVVPDYYLASTCIINNLFLVTVNRKDFEQIDGLKSKYFNLNSGEWEG